MLSVVIITKNEEKNIGRCLQSVQSIADEVIVVDSFSTDGTESICKKYGARFVQHEWMGYIDTKNYANSLANNDLIFSIDADEAVSEELCQSIQAIKNADVTGTVFSMNRRMNYCGKWILHGGWYPDEKVRIFDRKCVKWQGKKVHETLDIPADFENVKLNGDLLHYSFYTIEQHRKQNEHFAQLSADEAIEKGKKVNFATPYLHCVWKFIRDYILKGGFLDGGAGWQISKINARGIYLKYKLIRDTKGIPKNQCK